MPTDLTLRGDLPVTAASAAGTPSELALRFTGTAAGYFRIWAVNLCLTLLTLGVFSAWAKVRKKRYFYSHTTLDSTPFQYLAQPLPILKGRIVAVVLFAAWYVASNFFPAQIPYLLALGAVIAPWMVMRSAAFNARYSAFRNMTFHFDSNYGDAAKAIYGWQGIVIAVLIAGFIFQQKNADAATVLPIVSVIGIAALVVGLSFAWWMRRVKAYLVSRSSFGGEAGEFTATGRQFLNIYFMGGLIMGLAGILGGALGAFLMMVVTKVNPGPWQAALIMIPVYAGYVFAYGFVQARIGNLVWNSISLGPLRFQSALKGSALAMLYLTNALAILGSLGLMIPWAVIRTLRYRAEHMQVFAEGSLKVFHGGEQTAVQAAGAEAGEFFDLDVSL